MSIAGCNDAESDAWLSWPGPNDDVWAVTADLADRACPEFDQVTLERRVCMSGLP